MRRRRRERELAAAHAAAQAESQRRLGTSVKNGRREAKKLARAILGGAR